MITLVTNTPRVCLSTKDIERFDYTRNELSDGGILWKNVACYDRPRAPRRFRYTHLLVGQEMSNLDALTAQLVEYLNPISFEVNRIDDSTTWLSMRIPLKKGVTLEQRSIALTLMRMLSDEFIESFRRINPALKKAYTGLSSFEDLLRMVFRQACLVYGNNNLYYGHIPYNGYIPTAGSIERKVAAAEKLAASVYKTILERTWCSSRRLWGANRFSTGITEHVVNQRMTDSTLLELALERAKDHCWPL